MAQSGERSSRKGASVERQRRLGLVDEVWRLLLSKKRHAAAPELPGVEPAARVGVESVLSALGLQQVLIERAAQAVGVDVEAAARLPWRRAAPHVGFDPLPALPDRMAQQVDEQFLTFGALPVGAFHQLAGAAHLAIAQAARLQHRPARLLLAGCAVPVGGSARGGRRRGRRFNRPRRPFHRAGPAAEDGLTQRGQAGTASTSGDSQIGHRQRAAHIGDQKAVVAEARQAPFERLNRSAEVASAPRHVRQLRATEVRAGQLTLPAALLQRLQGVVERRLRGGALASHQVNERQRARVEARFVTVAGFSRPVERLAG